MKRIWRENSEKAYVLFVGSIFWPTMFNGDCFWKHYNDVTTKNTIDIQWRKRFDRKMFTFHSGCFNNALNYECIECMMLNLFSLFLIFHYESICDVIVKKIFSIITWWAKINEWNFGRNQIKRKKNKIFALRLNTQSKNTSPSLKEWKGSSRDFRKKNK